MAEGGPEPAERRRRWYTPLIGIAVGFVALAVLSVAVVAIPIGSSETVSRTPLDTLTGFETAVNQGDWGKADSFLSMRLRADMNTLPLGFADKAKLQLDQAVTFKQASNAALVQVEYRYTDARTGRLHSALIDIELVVEEGGWKIDTDFWNQPVN